MSLSQAAALLADKEAILVFTGAGISTGSGIPDFRGPDGVWTKLDPNEFTYDNYLRSADTRRRQWQWRFGSGLLDAEPNAGHVAIARMWTAGRVLGCVTQNIDGLHQRAGLPESAVVEVHGSVHRTRCLQCGASLPTVDLEHRITAGDDDPHCEQCGGILKTTVISFGEMMPQDAMRRAYALAATCDTVLAVGSTLSVYPAAEVPLEAARAGAGYVIVNQGPTEHDQLADVVVAGDASTVLTGLADTLLGP